MEKPEIPLEETGGYKMAMSLKPFIDPKCTDHMEIVKDIAQSINKAVEGVPKVGDVMLMDKVKQLLSALDYEKLTDYQCKLVLLIEQYLKTKL